MEKPHSHMGSRVDSPKVVSGEGIGRCAGRGSAAEEAAFLEGGKNPFHFPVEGFGAVQGEIGTSAGGADEADGAGANGGFVLEADGFWGAAALLGVATETTVVTDGVGRIDVDAELVEGKQVGEVKGEEAFDDEEAAGVDSFGLAGDADVVGEVVEGTLDGAAESEFGDVADQEWAFNESGVVEVLAGSLPGGQVAEVAVVVVEWEGHAAESVRELCGKSGFARAGCS